MKTQGPEGRENSLQDIVDYITLKKVLSEKLNRVL
jgi:DNA primase